MPKLGLGLAALGRPGYINLGRDKDLGALRSEEDMQEAAFKVLDCAYAQGIRYFDCARSYGLSEAFLARWLESRNIDPSGPNDFFAGDLRVGTKWGYAYTADWQVEVPGGGPHEVKDHTLNQLVGQAAESQALLGDHLNLLQIHSATMESGVLDDETVIDRLVRLRTHHGWRLGLTVSGVGQGAVVDKAVELGIFDCVQATFNVLEQSAGPSLERAHASGMDVMVKEALANGRALQLGPLVAAAKAKGCPADALALKAAMAQPFQPVVLSGAVSPEQMASNAQSLDLDLGAEELSALMDACRMDPAEYWNERSSLPWN